MSRTLTWEYLSPVHVARMQGGMDTQGIRKVLEEADNESSSGYFAELNSNQVQVLLDLFFHCLRFAKGQNMTSEKISTLVSILYHTHIDSIDAKATMQQSYAIMQSYLISHSVHRPPYSAAVFAVDDVKHINDYLMDSYYRHYKLYHYAFTKRNLATIKTSIVGCVTDVPPNVAPLSKAVPLAQWEATQAETQLREEEEAERRAEQEEANRVEEEKRAAAAQASGPPMSQGLKAQLGAIKESVIGMSGERLDSLEAKLALLESRQSELNKPSSAVGKSTNKRK